MAGKMTPDEVHQFLDSRPGWIVLTTVGRDGYPHSVPIGYFRLGDEVYMGCRANTQKTKNVERNPKVSLALEAGSSMADIKGVLTGISQAGKIGEKLAKVIAERGLPTPTAQSCPTTQWDVFGAQGHPVRATVSDLGPLLLDRM